MRKFSFCLAPAEYTIEAIDTASDSWWGGAYYSVFANGDEAIREEMEASTRQSTIVFTVSRSTASRTSSSENKALQGGGAIFWEDEPPGNTERYRNESTPNIALYEDDVATPARALSVVTNSRRRTTAATTLSGRELESPLAFELLDGYGQRGMSDDTSILLAELVDTSGTTTLSGPLAICEQGLATFTDLAIFAFPEVTVRFNVSIPALSEHVSPPTWISRLRNVLLA